MKETIELQLAGISLDRAASIALYRQLYESLRQMILGGRLRPGQRLPATRELANELKLSRNTVSLAYDCLLAEGYIEGIVGSGTYVNHELPEAFLDLPRGESQAQTTTLAKPSKLSKRGQRLARVQVGSNPKYEVARPFQHGLPALDEFPRQIWTRLIGRQWREAGELDLGYSNPAGYWPLREAVASYLRTSRAVKCEAGQVIIVNGSQQGLTLASNVLVDPGERVWIEDPCYTGAKGAFIAAQLDLVPIPVDDEGLNVAYGQATAPIAKMAYVTPSHQYPLGLTMSLKRRFELLQWAAQSESWILEDDYDSEFRYSGPPLASLQGLDYHNRVIYLGTFSKVLFPALRLGYLVVPADLVEAFISARAVLDRGSGIVEQAALAEFISEGHFGRHIRRMRLCYQARQQALLDAADHCLSDLLSLSSSESGMHLVGWLPNGVDDAEISQKLAKAGITALPVSAYRLQHPGKSGLVLGYTGYNELEIKRAVSALGQVLKAEGL